MDKMNRKMETKNPRERSESKNSVTAIKNAFDGRLGIAKNQRELLN